MPQTTTIILTLAPDGKRVIKTQKPMGHPEYKTNLYAMKHPELQREHDSVMSILPLTTRQSGPLWNARAKMILTELRRRSLIPLN